MSISWGGDGKLTGAVQRRLESTKVLSLLERQGLKLGRENAQPVEMNGRSVEQCVAHAFR